MDACFVRINLCLFHAKRICTAWFCSGYFLQFITKGSCSLPPCGASSFFFIKHFTWFQICYLYVGSDALILKKIGLWLNIIVFTYTARYSAVFYPYKLSAVIAGIRNRMWYIVFSLMIRHKYFGFNPCCFHHHGIWL